MIIEIESDTRTNTILHCRVMYCHLSEHEYRYQRPKFQVTFLEEYGVLQIYLSYYSNLKKLKFPIAEYCWETQTLENARS